MQKLTARPTLLAAALVVACATTPTAASAATPPPPQYASYMVAFDGTYAYRASEAGYGIMEATRTMDASWQSRTSRPLLISSSANHQTGVVTMPSSTTTFTGTYDEIVHAEHPVIQTCVLTQDKPGGEGLAGVKTDSDGTVTLDLQPLDHLSGKQACTKGVIDPDVAILGKDLSVKLTFPAARIGEGSIVLPASSDATMHCPMYVFTTTCDATWTGTVTLTRVPTPADEDISDLIVPLTPDPPAGPTPVGGGTVTPAHPAPVPAKPKPTTTDDDLGDLIVPLVPDAVTDAEIATLIAPLVPGDTTAGTPELSAGKDMRFDPEQVTLWFRTACDGGCTGTATFSAPAAGAGANRSAQRLEVHARRLGTAARVKRVTQAFAVRRGSRVVGLRLSAEARASFRKAKGGSLSLVLKDRKSHARTRTTVTLRAR